MNESINSFTSSESENNQDNNTGAQQYFGSIAINSVLVQEEHTDTDNGISTEQEKKNKETLFVYKAHQKDPNNLTFTEKVNKLEQLGFSVDSEYAGDKTFISYFDRDGDAAYSSEPYHTVYLVKGKLAIRMDEKLKVGQTVEAINKPSKTYEYFKIPSYELNPSIDIDNVEEINKKVNSAESLEDIVDRLWNNRDILTDKHSLIDLSEFVREDKSMLINDNTAKARAIRKELMSQHKNEVESGELILAYKNHEWTPFHQPGENSYENSYIVEMGTPEELRTVDSIGRYSKTIYQFANDSYETIMEKYIKYCEDNGLISPKSRYIKTSGFVTLENDRAERKMDYFLDTGNIRTDNYDARSYIKIFQPTLNEFKNIVKEIDN